jgi:hypothetical protein
MPLPPARACRAFTPSSQIGVEAQPFGDRSRAGSVRFDPDTNRRWLAPVVAG